jgi:hypothetical protein
MYVHSLACMTQTAVGDVGVFPSVDIHYVCLRNEQYLHLVSIYYKTELFSISK